MLDVSGPLPNWKASLWRMGSLPIYLFYPHLQLTTGLWILEQLIKYNLSNSWVSTEYGAGVADYWTGTACGVLNSAWDLGWALPCLYYGSLILRMIWGFPWLLPYSLNQSLDPRGAVFWLFNLLATWASEGTLSCYRWRKTNQEQEMTCP